MYRAAETVHSVIKRNILQFLKQTEYQRWWCALCFKNNWFSHYVELPDATNCTYMTKAKDESLYKWKMNTSVTMLSMPSMRLDVPNRDGFPDTADKTLWTNAKSWMASAHRGPPSYRRTDTEDRQFLSHGLDQWKGKRVRVKFIC